MFRFQDLKVGTKLAVSIGFCVLVTVVLGAVAVGQMQLLSTASANANHDAHSSTKLQLALMSSIRRARTLQYQLLLDDNAKDRTDRSKEIVDEFGKADKAMTDLFADDRGESRKALDELKLGLAAYEAANVEFLKRQPVTVAEGKRLLGSGPADAAFDEIKAGLVAFGDSEDKAANSSQAALTKSTVNAQRTIVVLIIFDILVGIAIIVSVNKYVLGHLGAISSRMTSLSTVCIRNLATAVSGMANGNLSLPSVTGTEVLEVKSRDEFGDVAVTLNDVIQTVQTTIFSFQQAQNSLSQLIAQTRATANSVAAGATELTSGTTDLSHRTSEQASSLEETAASMEEMTGIVKGSAESAARASAMANSARDIAAGGGETVVSAVASMDEINAASRRIADIISVIDEIAFQTNLLALNAAVEAARVGEQGRGFAVVASEVRNLAGRSSTAAKEIKSLVNDTVNKVRVGSDLVNASGRQLHDIVTAVEEVAAIVSEISAASQEQSAGIEQVNKAIVQMDHITQQNAALVEEATAASSSMAQQSTELQGLVSRFVLMDTGQPAQHSTKPQFAQPVKQVANGATKLTVKDEKPNLSLAVYKEHDSFEEF
ncbi:MAG TPA: methyl-accepting chemotaxis protein [Capsulimonadaceae bacterium]|jgi:methyl-accepting chemotaxis protein